MELRQGEQFFIEVVREFDFLRKLGYDGEGFNIIGREYWVTFKRAHPYRSITIAMTEPWELNVFIEKKTFWLGYDRISLRDLNDKGYFPSSIKSLSQLIQLEYLDLLKE